MTSLLLRWTSNQAGTYGKEQFPSGHQEIVARLKKIETYTTYLTFLFVAAVLDAEEEWEVPLVRRILVG